MQKILSFCGLNIDLWHVTYLNHLQEDKVALAQGLFVKNILSKEENLPHKNAIEFKLRNLMSQLSYLNGQLYQAYKMNNI